MKTLCVTGHRPDSLPWEDNLKDKKYKAFLKELERNLLFAIENGYTHFIAGGALGIDTVFEIAVDKLKKQGRQITLEIAVPCSGQENSWSTEDKRVYEKILKRADEVNVLSPVYYPFCMQNRNQYMVKKSDAVLCCWTGKRSGGTYSTIRLAEQSKKKLLYIDLSEKGNLDGKNQLKFEEKIT